jgi:hypothetical protein
MRDGTVRFAESGVPRVLLLAFDGGIGHTALLTDHELQLCTVESFARAERELSRFDPDVVVVAFADPPFEQVADLVTSGRYRPLRSWSCRDRPTSNASRS